MNLAVATVARDLPFWKAAALEAAKIAGIRIDPTNAHDPDIVAHMTVFKNLLEKAGNSLTDPRIINCELLGQAGAVAWRRGIPARMRGLPKAEYCKPLFEAWWLWTEHRARALKRVPSNEGVEFCRVAYATLQCLRVFREGNGRTALLTYHMLRQFIGLPPHLVTYVGIDELDEFVERFQREKFVPNFLKLNVLGRL